MRIVSGTARGRPLGRTPKGIRPTSDKVREALYDILRSVSGLSVLDLYAGTGALGLEALSRGAASAVFVDEDEGCVRAIRQNAATLGFADRSRILRLPVLRALRTLSKEGARFDLVLVDPPYGRELGGATLAALAESDLVGPDATLVVETATRDGVPAAAGLAHASSRRYGDTTLHFYERRTRPQEITLA